MTSGKPVTVTLSAPAAGPVELTAQQGAIPILKNGKVVAAIGVGGSTPANDEKFAQAGADAVSAGK